MKSGFQIFYFGGFYVVTVCHVLSASWYNVVCQKIRVRKPYLSNNIHNATISKEEENTDMRWFEKRKKGRL